MLFGEIWNRTTEVETNTTTEMMQVKNVKLPTQFQKTGFKKTNKKTDRENSLLIH